MEKQSPKVNLHKGHRDRMKKQFLTALGSGMPDHKLLEILLFYSTPQKDTNEMAHMLLQRFQSVRGVMEADVSELCEIGGIKENTAVLIKLIMELYRRYLNQEDTALFSSKDIAMYMLPKFIGLTEERLYMLCLTDKLTVERCIHISTGTSNSVVIDYKKIITTAASSKCNIAVLVHNHPGEYLEPSHADIQGTVKVARALREIGVNLADHVIVSGSAFVSMKDAGILTAI